MELSDEQRARLLSVARGAVDQFVSGAPRATLPDIDPALPTSHGVFVSLYLVDAGRKRLRGCIGTFEERGSIAASIAEMAFAAASRDPRFLPMTVDEIDNLAIELSVLSPRTSISADDVVVGRHGLSIENGAQRGVLLPQVPVENGWNRQQFLEHTCRKAGLPTDAWRDSKSQLKGFTATVFAEPGLAGTRR